MSRLFYQALNDQSTRGMGNVLQRSFATKQRKVAGTLLTATTIQVEGQTYPFLGAGQPGETLAVVNAGRKAAALYIPADGEGGVVVAGGGGGTTTVSLTSHQHTGAVGEGGVLAGYAATGHTHVEAGITDLDHNAVKLQGRTVVATAPVDGQALIWTDFGTEWGPGDLPPSTDVGARMLSWMGL